MEKIKEESSSQESLDHSVFEKYSKNDDDTLSEKSDSDAQTGEKKTEEKSYCDICYLEFPNNSSLSQHLTIHGVKHFMCFLCRKGFTQRSDLESHYKIHVGGKSFACDVCKKEYGDCSAFITHVCFYSNEKPNTSAKNAVKGVITNACVCNKSETNPCTTCQKEFSEEYSSVITPVHAKEYSSIISSMEDKDIINSDGAPKKRFMCDICQRGFHHRCRLNMHIRTHTGVRPISCNICSKRFQTMYQLITHLRIHTGEKPYECDTCGKVFSQSSTLNRHRLTHTGERPFLCDICQKGFCDRSDLTKHMRKHTGEKPFMCNICKKKFSRKSTLTSHLRRHNNREDLLNVTDQSV